MSHLRFAVVGSGPAGFFTAKSLFRHLPQCRVDVFERLPCPFGLIRYGVAPDHAEIKHVVHDFAKIAEHENFRFMGNAQIGPAGSSLCHSTLAAHYSGIVYAYGASSDKSLNIPGESLSHPARSFVEWYNAMPGATAFDLSYVQSLAIVGNGNVALDVARMLAKPLHEVRTSELPLSVYLALEASDVRDIHVIGRRGALQAACSIKELRLLTSIDGLSLRVFDRDMTETRASMSNSPETHQEARAKKRLFELFDSLPREPDPKARARIHFHFFQSPVEITNTAVKLQRNELKSGGKEVAGLAEMSEVKADLVLKSVGYRCVQIDESLPFDSVHGIVQNTDGRVLDSPSTYAAGWCRSGPVGILDSTMRSAFVTASHIVNDATAGLLKPVGKRLEVPEAVTWAQWQRIEEFELKRGKALGKCEVLGRRQSEDHSTLSFILQCKAGKALWRGKFYPVYRTIEEFQFLHTQLARCEVCREFRLLPEFSWQHIVSYDLEHLEYLQRKLGEYLDFLFSRKDISDSQVFCEWLNLPRTEGLNCVRPTLVSEFQTHPTFSATALCHQPADGILVVSLSDLGASSSFNVWNLIDTSAKGAYVIVPVSPTGLEGTMVTFESVEEIMTLALLRHGELFMGLRSGEIVWTHLTNMQDGGKWKADVVDQLKMHGGRVVDMAVCEKFDLVLSVSIDNCLRVFGPRHGKIEVVGGGSLRARLQEIHLSKVHMDSATDTIYLGTDSNRVLIYKLEGSKTIYQTMLVTRGTGPIGSIATFADRVFVADGNECQELAAAKQAVRRTQVACFTLPESAEAPCTIASIAVSADGAYLFVGYSVLHNQSGALLQWDLRTNELRAAVNSGAAKVVRLLCSFAAPLLMSLTEDGKLKARVHTDLAIRCRVGSAVINLWRHRKDPAAWSPGKCTSQRRLLWWSQSRRLGRKRRLGDPQA